MSSLRRGDLVEVLGPAAIMRTLDAGGLLDGLPFMPEMVGYCGRRFRVDRRADKVCDTITNSLQSRHLPDVVLLEDLRCDGAGHGGCEAECRLYWKEAWLRRVEPGELPVSGDGSADLAAVEALKDLVQANSRVADPARFRCQATQILAASLPMSTTDPRPYVRELTTGNVSLRTFGRVMGRAAVMQPLHHFGRLPVQPLKGASPTSPATAPLDLQPGEWVRVRSREEIQNTLTDKGANRGLWFDREMMALCGQVMQVRGRVSRLINESTGEMIELRSDCIKLEGGVCSGELSTGRWFCPREIYSYWRECWLERVDAPVSAGAIASDEGTDRGRAALARADGAARSSAPTVDGAHR